jgi:hypothetical protein
MIRPEHRTWSIAVLMLVGVGLSAVGCKDSSNSETDRDAASDEDAALPGEDAGEVPGDDDAGAGDAAADDAAGGSDASGDDGGDAAALAPTCSEYCSTIQANCMAANQQYPSTAICMAVCTSFPPGAVGATSGNTLGCRLTHAGYAAGSNATTHCHHAGITGGDLDPTDTTAGACGEGCDAFCNEALVACTNATTPGGTAPYASKEACMAECKMFPASSSNFSTAATSGNTFHCRAYHLTAASTTPNPHCGHVKLVSPTCN